MTTKVKPIPEGWPSVAPYLIVEDAARAIEFYKRVFGATEIMRLNGPDGSIAHAEIKVGTTPVMIADENLQWGTRSPQTLGGSPVVLHLYVEDVDAVAQRAVASGARLLIPVEDQFYGDRSGRLVDPFGHLWIVSTHTEDVPPEEMKKRMAAFSKPQE